MSKADACIVSNDDDWDGLYINGKLVFEGHSIPNTELLDALKGKTLVGYERRTCDQAWLYDHGNLPDDLARVKWAKP